MTTNVSHSGFAAAAQQRLRSAGLSEDEIAPLIERASQIVEGLARLAALDPELPEPALTWQPVEEAAS